MSSSTSLIPVSSSPLQQLSEAISLGDQERNSRIKHLQGLFKHLQAQDLVGAPVEQSAGLLHLGQQTKSFSKLRKDIKHCYRGHTIKAQAIALALLKSGLEDVTTWDSTGLGRVALQTLVDWASTGAISKSLKCEPSCDLLEWAYTNSVVPLSGQLEIHLLRRHALDPSLLSFVGRHERQNLGQELLLLYAKHLKISVAESENGYSLELGSLVSFDKVTAFLESFASYVSSLSFPGPPKDEGLSRVRIRRVMELIPEATKESLRELRFSGNSQVSTDFLEELLRDCPNIISLDLSGSQGELRGAIKVVRANAPKLLEFHVTGSSLTSAPFLWEPLGIQTNGHPSNLITYLKNSAPARRDLLRAWWREGGKQLDSMDSEIRSSLLALITDADLSGLIKEAVPSERLHLIYDLVSKLAPYLDAQQCRALELERDALPCWYIASRPVSEAFIRWLNQANCTPRELKLERKGDWTPTLLLQFLKGLKRVQKMDFHCLNHFSNEDLDCLKSLPRTLTTLRMNVGGGMEAGHLGLIGTACPGIRQLTIRGEGRLSTADFALIDQSFPRLERFSLSKYRGDVGDGFWSILGMGKEVSNPVLEARKGERAVIEAVSRMIHMGHKWLETRTELMRAVIGALPADELAKNLLPKGRGKELLLALKLLAGSVQSVDLSKALEASFKARLSRIRSLELNHEQWSSDLMSDFASHNRGALKSLSIDFRAALIEDYAGIEISRFKNIETLKLTGMTLSPREAATILLQSPQLLIKDDTTWWISPFRTLGRKEAAFAPLLEIAKEENGRLRQDLLLTLLALPAGREWMRRHSAAAREILLAIPQKDYLDAAMRMPASKSLRTLMSPVGLLAQWKPDTKLLVGSKIIPASGTALGLISEPLRLLLIGKKELRLEGLGDDAVQVIQDLVEFSQYDLVKGIDPHRAEGLIEQAFKFQSPIVFCYCENLLIDSWMGTDKESRLELLAKRLPLLRYRSLKAAL